MCQQDGRRGGFTVFLFLLATLLGGAGCTGAPAADPSSAEGVGAGQADPSPRSIQPSGGVNRPEMQGRPYVVLVSFDGYRHDFPELYAAPTMNRLAARGVRARALRPVYPTLTFPNHYAIATGTYPGTNGLVANSFVDPATGEWYSLRDREAVEDGAWYGAEPIWVTAESQGMVTAAFFFVGTEADIQGVHPTHWNTFDYDVTGEARVDQVLSWLSEPPETRPHLITLYFEHVDSRSHEAGPESPETEAAVAQVDGFLARLLDGIGDLAIGDSVYVVAVSDHGQMGYREDGERFAIDRVVDMANIQRVGGGSYMYLHVPEENPVSPEEIRTRINQVWEHGTAYLTEEAPAAWGVQGNPRYGQVLVVPDPGYAVGLAEWEDRALPRGEHGWAPETPEMAGIFIAAGPGLPVGLEIDPVSSVDIYPLLAAILGLDPAPAIDGDPERLVPLLSRNP